MLYYNKIDISEGTDHNKSNKSRDCLICQNWLFKYGFKFQDYVCNGCDDLSILSLNINDIAISTVKNVDYGCIIHSSKFEAIY